ncbi:hypothetical protein EV715DRAFT_202079 [Schizophyllum commune]
MPSLATVREFNSHVTPIAKPPVAVFVGGTSGIGRGMARAFAHHMKGNARLIIIGRNQSAADALIASLPAPANTLSSFLPCEASLMRNIDAACAQLAKRDVDKINYLVLSVGEFVGFSHEETEEGVDKNYAALFFGRFRWIRNLAPMLDRAAEAGEEAKVMSVARAGKGGPVDWDDLDGKKSLRQQRLSAPTYQDLMLQGFAKRHPKVAFTHSYPGLVGDVVQGYLGTDEEIEKMWDYACNRPGVPYQQ